MVIAIAVAAAPTNKMATLIVQTISFSEACKMQWYAVYMAGIITTLHTTGNVVVISLVDERARRMRLEYVIVAYNYSLP